MTGLLARVFAMVGICLLLAACSEEEKSAAEPHSRPVKTFVVSGVGGEAIRTFPGQLDAAQRAELGFRVPGQLQEILVKEGDFVAKGQIIAKLDPADYQLVYEDRKASFDNARSNFDRANDLVADGNISRMDFDRMEAEYRSAAAALSQAEQDLKYTVLTSPFGGRIARRWVENFEDVAAKQTVFTLQNIDQLDVVIYLPESIVRTVRRTPLDEPSIADSPGANSTHAYATFEGKPGEKFALIPKEIATTADEQTQTFRTTFTMDAPGGFTVLPGMTTTVYLDFSGLVQSENARLVPVRAVQADAELQSRVWVLDPESMTVSPQPVTVGRMTGNRIEVTSGLSGGEEIVAVGAPYLADGMRVTRMEKSEQAAPRSDEAQ